MSLKSNSERIDDNEMEEIEKEIDIRYAKVLEKAHELEKLSRRRREIMALQSKMDKYVETHKPRIYQTLQPLEVLLVEKNVRYKTIGSGILVEQI
mgnify:CR=1 FL=1|tara:strand:- start:1768 stop:2052 length:285 start_codon:yes stop_codon:yes gene_type:complete